MLKNNNVVKRIVLLAWLTISCFSTYCQNDSVFNKIYRQYKSHQYDYKDTLNCLFFTQRTFHNIIDTNGTYMSMSNKIKYFDLYVLAGIMKKRKTEPKMQVDSILSNVVNLVKSQKSIKKMKILVVHTYMANQKYSEYSWSYPHKVAALITYILLKKGINPSMIDMNINTKPVENICELLSKQDESLIVFQMLK